MRLLGRRQNNPGRQNLRPQTNYISHRGGISIEKSIGSVAIEQGGPMIFSNMALSGKPTCSSKSWKADFSEDFPLL